MLGCNIDTRPPRPSFHKENGILIDDRFDDSKYEGELKFSREQGFFDKSTVVRWLIGAFFIFSLFAFLHFRDVRVEMLELDTIAPSYVVAQVDFDFFDEKATEFLRQEKIRDIGKVYIISEKDLHKQRGDFEDDLVKNQGWRKGASESSLEEMYQAMDALQAIMKSLRFTDPRTLKKMQDQSIDTAFYQVYTPANVEEKVTLPPQIWDYIKEQSFKQNNFSKETTDYIIGYFTDKGLQLHEDASSKQKIQNKIQASVPEKYSHISAGSRIIDRGDKVTSRHLAILQAMKKALSEKRNLWHPLTLLGSLLMTLLFTGICYAFLKINHPYVLTSNRKLFLIVTIVVITLFLSKITELLLLSSVSNLIEVIRYPVFVPFAAIMLCSLMNPNIAIFASGFLVIVMTLTLAFDRQGFMVMNLTAALVAILSTRSLRRRKEIFVVCGKAWLSCILIAISINFYNNVLWGMGIVTDILSVGLFMLLTSVMVVGLLPLLESIFRIMTDVTLMEYMDPNNDLLRRLSIEAPGTYQHSIVVGNLAETAAMAIGANGLFCRVATLYHDVGKIITPQYFTENQQPGMNIHQLLTPSESAQVIIAHVAEGVALARKAGLPEQFIDVIKEHHGTTLVYYFYRKQLEKLGGDLSQIDEKEFRYSGPKPRSKECVIIMIADTLEAASRSLETCDEKTVEELATRLIKEKAEDGQFDECILTFEELATVKETLVKTLCAFAHSRVKYPKREEHPSEIRDGAF